MWGESLRGGAISAIQAAEDTGSTSGLADVDLHCGQNLLFAKRAVLHGDRAGGAGGEVLAGQVDDVGLLGHADLTDVLEELLLDVLALVLDVRRRTGRSTGRRRTAAHYFDLG